MGEIEAPTGHSRRTAHADAPSQGVPRADDRWFCGPAADRRAYVTDDVEGIQGGQGRVVRAERRTFDGDPVGYSGPVSLKLTTERRPERVALLRDRWRLLTAVDHPHLARALEVFEGPGLFRTACPPATDDVLYVAATWVEGTSLRAAGPLSPGAAVALARDVAAGLAALHAQGLVHRDVHPGNVIVGEDGRATLIDFGSVRPDDDGTTATAAGALGFVPPETLHQPGGLAADRWGLGMVTVFALLGHPQGATGRAELEAELSAVLAGTGTGDHRRAVQLLADMVDPDPARRPEDGERWARQLADALAARPAARQRWVLALVGALAVLGAAGAGAASLTTRAAPPRAPAATAAAPRCAPTSARGASPELMAAVDRAAPEACPIGEPLTFVDAEVHPVADASGGPDGVVVSSPSGDAVHLDPTLWTSYREIAGKVSPENAVLFGGYPTRVDRSTVPGAVLVHLDGGGHMVGRRDDTQLFWLPTQVLDLHEAHGGLDGDLGFPMTNPYFSADTLRIDFEGGYMEAPLADLAGLLGGQPVDDVVLVDDPAAQLAGVAVEERIVRQRSGTAWWVDADGRRHWIPDGETWQCLGGDAALAADDLRGFAVATLPLAEKATCP